MDTYSAIWPLELAAGQAQLLDARRMEADRPQAGIADPMYFIAVCGHDAAAVDSAARAFSLLSDRDHWALRDYQAAHRRLAELQAHLERIEAAYHASQQQLAALAQERDRLAAQLGTAPPPASGTAWRRR